MHPMLSLDYWFSIRPIPFTPAVERGLLVFFAVFAVVGIAAYLVPLKRGFSKPAKRALSRFASLLTWSGITGLILWTFSYQQVPALSMRFLFVLWLIWPIWGFYAIYRYLWVELPKKEKMREERIEREKWLPKKKK